MTRFWRARIAVAAFAAVLAACASPYGPRGITGGFVEQKLSDNTYRVGYYGNGHTQEDQVVNYWLYRCAELTIQNGFSYFGMAPETGRPTSGSDAQGLRRQAQFRPDAGEPRFVQVKGGGGYVFIPSYSTYTIRTWHKNGTIVMFHSRLAAITPEQAYSLHAQTVMDMLGEYVKSGAKAKPPLRSDVLDAAMRHPAGPSAIQALPEGAAPAAR